MENGNAINFDQMIDRRHTNSVKWDTSEAFIGDGVLPMWVADMDFSAPAPVIDAIQRRAEHGILGYSIIPDTCYAALINWLHTRHHWDVQREWIVVVPGTMPAVYWTILAFTQPGDRVIVQPPVYPPFFKAARLNDCDLLENPLIVEDGRYVMDLDRLARQIDARTKVLILCSPHNPVGRVWTRVELLQLGELCAQRGVLLCSDEIHADLVFPGATHVPAAALSDDIAQNTITCISPNKTFNLAGVSMAFAIIPNPRLRNAFEQMQSTVGGHVSGNLFGALAAEAAYTHGAAWLTQAVQYLHENRDFLRAALTQHLPQISMIPPEGTYLAWLDCRALGLSDKQLQAFMRQQARLWLNDGDVFGTGGTGFQRLNFACPRSVLQEAVHRLTDAVRML